MLELILGRAGTGKTTLLRKRLAESTAPKTILIVPEQYTFESERALLMEYGAETANRVQVYSFTRLAQAAFLQYGGGAGKRLTDGGRRILMTLALENCADQLTLFEKSADRMTDVLLNTVGEMKICGIEPDMLTKTAEAVTEDSLSRKLKEIALIYGTYEALVAQTYLDPLDDLTRLDDLLADHPDFSEMLMSPSMRLTALPCRSTAFCATHCAMRKKSVFRCAATISTRAAKTCFLPCAAPLRA